MTSPQHSTSEITENQGKTLLKLARQTIATRLGLEVPEKERIELERDLEQNVFQEDRGTFVTLHKHGQLRGCIGTIAPVEAISSGIRRNAENAAFGDPRFTPVQVEEYINLDIEISILTDPKPLEYGDGADLVAKLRQLADQRRVALFLKGYEYAP